MSWKPEVKVDGQWSRNSLVFATESEAAQSAAELFGRWMMTTDHRAVEVDEPVTYALIDGRMVDIKDVIHG